MSRTIRDYYKPTWCWHCSRALGQVSWGVKVPEGVCPHNPRPWTIQHKKKVRTRRRNKYKNRHCCGGNIFWVEDFFWLMEDIRRNELVSAIDDEDS